MKCLLLGLRVSLIHFTGISGSIFHHPAPNLGSTDQSLVREMVITYEGESVFVCVRNEVPGVSDHDSYGVPGLAQVTDKNISFEITLCRCEQTNG